MALNACLRRQQGHRSRRRARAVVSLRRTLAIECATWRSGRIGGAARSITGGKVSRRALRGFAPSRGGKHRPLGDQEGVSRDAQGGVVVETAPAPPLVASEPEHLF